MVRGIDSFREWFRGYEDNYAIIGGTDCDILMTDEGLSFRAFQGSYYSHDHTIYTLASICLTEDK